MVGFLLCFVVLVGMFSAIEPTRRQDAFQVGLLIVGVPAMVYLVGTHLSLLP